MKYKTRSGLAGLLAAAFIAVASPVFAQTVILDDSFDRANSGVNGQTVENWNSDFYGTAPTWTSTVNSVINNNAVTGNAHVSIYNRVATPNQTEGILTLSADITFGTTWSTGSVTAEWIGLAFTADTTVGITGSNNTLLVILRDSGHISIFKNGTTTNLQDRAWSSWNATAFDPTATYNFAVVYDRTEGLVNVLIDGVAINSVALTVGTLNSETFGSVGIQMLPRAGGNLTNTAFVDNFLYTTSIPEPSAFAALFGGVALMVVATRRRRRLG